VKKAGFATGLFCLTERLAVAFRYLGTMQPHILTIPDDNVYEQLVQLAASAGLHIAANGLVSKPETPKRSREELLAIIRRGGDGLSIPDPLT
jgi:hypothetical protein